jgi:HEPN domain-containing protein
VDRRDLQELSSIRLKEAKALLSSGLYDGAYYLAGYAVECALKACIAKETKRYEFPDKGKVNTSHSHNLRELVRVAELEEVRIDHAGKDADFRANWDIAREWSEQSRYRRHRPESARALVDAVANRQHGVISWIKRHW